MEKALLGEQSSRRLCLGLTMTQPANTRTKNQSVQESDSIYKGACKSQRRKVKIENF